MAYRCPVCAYDRMAKPPVHFTICSSCGTEFGYDDSGRTYDELRTEWIHAGAVWFSQATPPPQGWNGYRQLLQAGYGLRPAARSADTSCQIEIPMAATA